MFLIWLGEQMTTRGVGNGISFIIFAGIVARLPLQIGELIKTGAIVQLVLLVAVFIATIWIIITVTQGERRIPVKYAPRQAGQRMVQGQRSYLPLKMAAAGVIPIIFAISIVLFPGQIATWYLGAHQADVGTSMFNFAEGVQNLFSPRSWFASLCYGGLVMLFTYFYTAVLFERARFGRQPQALRRPNSGLRARTPDRNFHQSRVDAHHFRGRFVPRSGRADAVVDGRRFCSCRKLRAPPEVCWWAAPVCSSSSAWRWKSCRI